MPRLHFYVDDEVAKQLRVSAKKANLTLSNYLSELVMRETGAQHQCPEATQSVASLKGLVRKPAAPVSIESMNEAISLTGSRESLINTKHGKAVAKLIPMPPETTLFGAMANSVKLEHDIDSTLCNDWEASCNGQTDE